MTETPEVRLKRLQMRSMRRGIKEMDIILTRFVQARLAGMSNDDLDLYEAILDENDQDLYQWVTGQVEAPKELAGMIDEIASLVGAHKL